MKKYKSVDEIAEEISEVIEAEQEGLPPQWEKKNIEELEKSIKSSKDLSEALLNASLKAVEEGLPERLKLNTLFYVSTIINLEELANLSEERMQKIIKRYEEITGLDYQEEKTKYKELMKTVK